ncbi:hypothetical protein VTN00DRAFT_5271 [Thermoascus crustaceus]|uniref:uncharacterized protein n=1 Tax=Thermoascus crustaceus TaxID=5088 RepID=UPI003743E4D0
MPLDQPIDFDAPDLPTLEGRRHSNKDRTARMKRNANNIEYLPTEIQKAVRRRDDSPHDDTRVSLAKFKMEKAQALGAPFEDGRTEKRRPEPLNLGNTSFANQPSAGTTGNAPPLSGDAIARILKQTKPDCPKAQAWIRAHEISKLGRKETPGSQTPSTNVGSSNQAPNFNNLEAGPECPPGSNLDRVREAHDRLQKALFG